LDAEILGRDFYVDDLISGAISKKEAINMLLQKSALLSRGNFELK